MDMLTPTPVPPAPVTSPSTAPASSVPPTAMPPTAAPSAKKPHGKLPYVLALVVIALLIVLGVVFAAINGLIDLPFLSPKPPTLSEITQSLSTIQSAEVTTAFVLKAAPREANVQESDLSKLSSPNGDAANAALATFGDTRQMITTVPSDLDVEGSITTDWARADAQSDSQTSINGSFTSGGFSAAFDGAVRVVGTDAYVQVNKLPIPFVDVGSLNGAWVKLPGKGLDMTALFDAEDPTTQVFQTASEADKPSDDSTHTDWMKELNVLFEKEIDAGALTIARTDTVNVDGVQAWDYTLATDDQKFFQTFNALYDVRKTTFPDIDQFVILNSRFTDDQIAAAQELDKNSSLHLVVGKKSRLPISFTESDVIAPRAEDAPKLADKEIQVRLTLSLAKVNEPVQIQAPEGALSIKQATEKLMGLTDEQVLFSDQVKIITDLRDALKMYKDATGAYPANLAQMVGQDFPSTLPAGRRTIVNIPNDQYTQAPFVYSVSETDGYHLVYTLHFSNAISSFETDGYVDGANTATAFDNSVEGYDATYDDDDDGDGLTNGQEDAYGTSRWMPDTDGDGFTDKQEIDGGFDPLNPPL